MTWTAASSALARRSVDADVEGHQLGVHILVGSLVRCHEPACARITDLATELVGVLVAEVRHLLGKPLIERLPLALLGQSRAETLTGRPALPSDV